MEQIAPDVWTLSKPLRLGGLPFGCRMTIVRMKNGELWVHSPIYLDSNDRKDIDRLGVVRKVVAPNDFHHIYLKSFLKFYPGANFYAVPAVVRKQKSLPTPILFTEDFVSPWRPEIDTVIFKGGRFFREAVFFHLHSRTLILTDLAMNFQNVSSPAHRLGFRLSGVYRRFGPSRIAKLLIRDRERAREAMKKILLWDFERVIVAHGEILESAARERLRAGYAWLLEQGRSNG